MIEAFDDAVSPKATAPYIKSLTVVPSSRPSAAEICS